MMKLKFNQPLRYLKPLKPEDFLDMENIDWFSNCGNEVAFTTKHKMKRIESLTRAVNHCNSIEWENFQLEKSNDLASFLNRTRKNEWSEWNTITEGIKAYLNGGIFQAVKKKLERSGLPESVFNSVTWDILNYYQETAYKKYNIPVFYTHLLPVYKNGHLPCGYKGSFPNGTIFIF